MFVEAACRVNAIQLLESRLTIRFTRGGDLLPWIGPALRGAVAYRFKQAACVQPAAERETHWKYCTGCPHLSNCPYGCTFEAQPDAGRAIRGQDDGLRPIVVAPRFPLSSRIAQGTEVEVRLLLLGNRA